MVAWPMVTAIADRVTRKLAPLAQMTLQLLVMVRAHTYLVS
jgi:hypothetical protein